MTSFWFCVSIWMLVTLLAAWQRRPQLADDEPDDDGPDVEDILFAATADAKWCERCGENRLLPGWECWHCGAVAAPTSHQRRWEP